MKRIRILHDCPAVGRGGGPDLLPCSPELPVKKDQGHPFNDFCRQGGYGDPFRELKMRLAVRQGGCAYIREKIRPQQFGCHHPVEGKIGPNHLQTGNHNPLPAIPYDHAFLLKIESRPQFILPWHRYRIADTHLRRGAEPDLHPSAQRALPCQFAIPAGTAETKGRQCSPRHG
ncbi:MAG: hypothetical protein ACD_74C00272G0001 [uncultured bacterium]|nr:MAG: hypothetical protein ACD_74C00272G0001 [uncultured bacterium]